MPLQKQHQIWFIHALLSACEHPHQVVNGCVSCVRVICWALWHWDFWLSCDWRLSGSSQVESNASKPFFRWWFQLGCWFDHISQVRSCRRKPRCSCNKYLVWCVFNKAHYSEMVHLIISEHRVEEDRGDRSAEEVKVSEVLYQRAGVVFVIAAVVTRQHFAVWPIREPRARVTQQ